MSIDSVANSKNAEPLVRKILKEKITNPDTYLELHAKITTAAAQGKAFDNAQLGDVAHVVRERRPPMKVNVPPKKS